MDRDEIVFQSGSIVITKTLARFGDITYPVNGIGSVYVAKPKRGALIAVGIVAGLFGLAALSDSDTSTGGLVALGTGVVLILAAIGRSHKLMLRTASGDQQAHESRNYKELLKLKSAIERAVTLRG